MRQFRKRVTVGLLLAATLFAVACTDGEGAEEAVSASEQGSALPAPSDSDDTDSGQSAFGTEEKPSAKTTEKESRTDVSDKKPIELPILP